MGCDWYFRPDEYRPDLQAAMVHRVRADPFLELTDKKALLQCWFDTTYGQLRDNTFDVTDSRDRIRTWMTTIGVTTIEDALR